MLDMLIKGGMVVDGSGSAGFYAAVAVQGDTVTLLRGDVSDIKAKRTIDATGRIVAPGFIDPHAHSALMVLHDPVHLPKVHQGVTTELYGIDGNSYAPFAKQQDLDDFITLNAGLEGSPPINADWSTVTEYLAKYDKKVSVNVAYIVGNSPIRIGAMGWSDRKPTKKELDAQKGLLRESMEEGAVGISTGLDYPPGSFAHTDELVELSKEAAKLGGFYHTHVRYGLGDKFLDPYREALDIGRRSGIPIHLTHMMPRAVYPGSSWALVDMVEEARDEGMDVTFDNFPYAHGGTRLVYFLPHWTHDGGVQSIYAALRSPEARERIRKETSIGFRESWDHVWVTYFKHERNKKYEGRSVAEVAEMMGKSEVDAICDLLLDEDLQTSFHAAGHDYGLMPDFAAHENYMVGSDALLIGDYPPAMGYGCFPEVIGNFCRNQRKMTLPQAIRKMTSFPAQRIGIKDRGLLRDGMKADITIFDYENIKAMATRDNPKRMSQGIDYVIVNGQVVVDHGKHTGVFAGRAIKRT
ncbi:MAG: D-aminoacylase [Chloroflexi bacterium]|nr:D-aminoacylase [Chloroflexota bacterium]